MMTNAEAQKSKILLSMIDEAKKAKDGFNAVGKEISQFAYAKDHGHLYKGMAAYAENPFNATVSKTAEYLETVGPALYQTNPDRRVNPDEWADDVSKARAAIMQDLLNYTPNETDLAGHSTRAINDALVWGAGVLWTGYNPDKKLIQSVWDSIDNLLLDPTASVPEDIVWGARKRFKPKWWLNQRYPEAKAKIAAIQCDDVKGRVTVYEVYCKIGLHNFNANGAAIDYETNEAGDKTPFTVDEPKKYVITEDGKILSEGDWEIPYFLDDRWPWELVYYRDGQGDDAKRSVWPTSPLQSGLGFQKALDFIYTWYLTKAEKTTGTVITVARQNGQGVDFDAFRTALRTARSNGYGVLEIEINGENMKFEDFVQQWNLQVGIQEFDRFVAIVETAFERATGLTEFLSSGQTEHQFRSAEEARLKDQNARTRFDHMRIITEKWGSSVARKEAQAWRFLMKGPDVARVLGPKAGTLWGELVPPMDMQLAKGQEAAIQAGITDPNQAQVFALQYREQQFGQGVIYEQWLLENEYDIESGTTQAKNIQQQQKAADMFMERALAELMRSPLTAPAGIEGIKAWAKLSNMPPAFMSSLDQAVAALKAPRPMPPPPGPPGAPPAPIPQG